MAFQDYRILGDSKFVGLENFIRAFTEERFWVSMQRTVLYVVLSLGLGFFAPLILAFFLSEVPRCKMLFRTLFYLPAVTSSLVIMFLWKSFYRQGGVASGEPGLFNKILGFFQIPPQMWLDDPKLAMLCVIIPGIWAGVGSGSIIYLAALKTIPEEFYESADMDGAGVLSKMWHVTLPFLKPLIIINFVGVFIGAFHAMENILVMTGGGPLNATWVIGIEIFTQSFIYLKFGYATAIAWILGLLLIGFTIYQLRILRNLRFTTAD